jgi:hypothetical protein
LLKNCKIEYLFFKDELRNFSDQTITFPPDPNPLTCNYTYSNNTLDKVVGGFIMVPMGTNLSNLVFSDHAYDSIVKMDNTIYSFAKVNNLQGIVSQDTLNNIVFYFDSKNRLIKIIRKNGFHPEGFAVNYIYSENQIIETTDYSLTKRFFYFDNGNLNKVQTEFYDYQGKVIEMKEILFQDFDKNPNPFKNLFYARGAFFRAFSNNNYISYRINEYCLSPDSSFYLCNTSYFSMQVQYNENSYPLFGEYE